MRGRGAAVAWLLLAATAAAGPSAHVPAPSVVAETSGFSVRIPAGWTRRGFSADEVLVVSPGRGAQGPVVGADQAAILVRPLGEVRSDADFDRLLASRAEGTAPARRPVRARGGDCGELVETEGRDASGPGPVELDTSLYCRARGRVVVVQLTRQAGDRREAAHRAAALATAASLRLREPAAAGR